MKVNLGNFHKDLTTKTAMATTTVKITLITFEEMTCQFCTDLIARANANNLLRHTELLKMIKQYDPLNFQQGNASVDVNHFFQLLTTQ